MHIVHYAGDGDVIAVNIGTPNKHWASWVDQVVIFDKSWMSLLLDL